MKSLSEKIASNLLSIKAVFLRPNEPFTWASGIKSPIYCDNRLTLSFPRVRDEVEEGLASVVREFYPSCEVVAGTATAGIAHAACVATLLDLPMIYVRSGAKSHGRGNQIEGVVPAGKNVVVIEDLISTAGSSIEVAEALRQAGANVLGIASIFTYGLASGVANLRAANLANHSLSDFETLVRVAKECGYIDAADVAKILAFQKNPTDAGWMSV